MPDVKRILVPTDFSTTSEIAFRYAIDLGRTHGASIHLLHVLEPTSPGAAYPEVFSVEPPALRAPAIDEVMRRLEAMRALSAAARVTTTTEVRVGRPTDDILGVAAARGTDLVVMGTHGRRGVAHLLLGSVAEHVVRAAPCAVLTLREASRVGQLVAQDVGPAVQQ